ncbi:hypothetical protein [Sulfurimonas sp.]|uniref:hypothetical protein n=1 Tax=Sulfurimonas sp. TaxID=2022749 RepID=UPI003D09A318
MLRNFLLSLGFITLFFHGCGSTPPEPEIVQKPIEQNITKPLPPSLTINAPDGATIKILNIKPKYYAGIELEADNYQVEISKHGYQTYTTWIEVNKPTIYNVTLKKLIDIPTFVWNSTNEQFYTLYDPKTELIWALPSEYVDYVKQYTPKEFLPKTIGASSKKFPQISRTKLNTIIYIGNENLSCYYRSKRDSYKKYFASLNKLKINGTQDNWRLPNKKDIYTNNPFQPYQQYFQLIWNKGNLVKMNVPVIYTYKSKSSKTYTSALGYKKKNNLYNGAKSSYIQNLNYSNNVAVVTPVKEKNSEIDAIVYDEELNISEKFYALQEIFHSSQKTIKTLLGDPKLSKIYYDKKAKRLRGILYSTTNNFHTKFSVKTEPKNYAELKEKILDNRVVPVVRIEMKNGELHYKYLTLKTNRVKKMEEYDEAKRSKNINFYREFIRLYPNTTEAKNLQKLIDQEYKSKYL